MTKKLTILKNTKIFKEFIQTADVIGEFEKNAYANFTREYRRNGMNWYEVFLPEGGGKGYIEKKNAFIWEHIKIKSEEAHFVCTNQENFNQRVPLQQGNELYVIAPHPHKTPVYRVRDLKNREGRLSGQVEIGEVEDEWTKVLFWIVFLAIVILSFLFMLKGGMIVISGLLLLILAGIAMVGVIITYILVLILKDIIHQIRIRR